MCQTDVVLYLILFFPHLRFKAWFREGVLVALCATLSLYFLYAANVCVTHPAVVTQLTGCHIIVFS